MCLHVSATRHRPTVSFYSLNRGNLTGIRHDKENCEQRQTNSSHAVLRQQLVVYLAQLNLALPRGIVLVQIHRLLQCLRVMRRAHNYVNIGFYLVKVILPFVLLVLDSAVLKHGQQPLNLPNVQRIHRVIVTPCSESSQLQL